jgi:hypothetical protein
LEEQRTNVEPLGAGDSGGAGNGAEMTLSDGRSFETYVVERDLAGE